MNINNSKNPKKNILIILQRGWAKNIGLGLAKQFYNNGYNVSCVVFQKSILKLIQKQNKIHFEKIISHEDILDFPEKILKNKNISIKDVCIEMGVETIWPYVQSLRNHVKSYKQKFYYGYMQNVDDENILNYLKAVHVINKKIFDEIKPDIIIRPKFFGFYHINFNLLAMKRSIPMFGTTDTKVNDLNIFTTNFYETEGLFFDNIKINSFEKRSDEIQNISKDFLESKRKNLQRVFAYGFARKQTIMYNTRVLLKNIIKSLIKYNYNIKLKSTIDNPGVIISVRNFFYYYINYLKNKNFKYDSLKDIKSSDIVFFPLQFQPEANIDVLSWQFNNQIETIRQIAMRLPHNYVLLVKDHPAMLPFRSNKYLTKISKIANVKLIKYDYDIKEIFNKISIIISPSTSVFFEASLYNLPCLQLGNNGITTCLPNVKCLINFDNLSNEILLKNTIIKQLNYESSLLNYIAASFECGFDLNYVGVWERNEKKDEKKFFDTYKEEVERLIS